jgi:hypothetical protein
MSNRLSNREVMVIVNRYIGVEGGYLGDFVYRTHAEFYPLYCDLDINPYEIDGTTRERFIKILSSQSPKNQALIIQGVLERFPVDAENKPDTRTQKLHDELEETASRLETGEGVSAVSLQTSYAVVLQALQDAELLLSKSNASSGIDRLFTALQGYMEFILDDINFSYIENDSITSLYKNIRDNHPAFHTSGHREQDIKRILQSMSTIIDTLQPVRNKASLAHPNPLLEEPEAMLVINSTRTILHYLDSKVQSWKNQQANMADIPL